MEISRFPLLLGTALSIRPRQFAHHLIEVEAGGLLTDRKLLETRQPLSHDRLRLCLQEKSVVEPVVVHSACGLRFRRSIPFDVSRLARPAASRGDQLESWTTGPRIDESECIIQGCISRKRRAPKKFRGRSPYLADRAVITTLIRYASRCTQIRIAFRNLDATGNPAASSNCKQSRHSAEKGMHSEFC